MTKHRSTHIRIQPTFCLVIAFALLILPLGWVCAWLTAVFVHELSHFAALRLWGKTVYAMQLTPGGAVMEAEELSEVQQLFCAMAGPVGSFLLLPMVRMFPKLAVCAAIQGFYNLLPIFPLDGGRALHSLLLMLIPQHADRIASTIAVIIKACMLAVALYLTFGRKLGILPVMAAGYILLKSRNPLANMSVCR